jgi:ABC-type transport system substrate-binding protein
VNYGNPRVDEINDILATETDMDTIMELWTEAVEIMIEDVPAVFLADANYQVATRDDIAGIVVEPDSLLSWYDLYRK